GAIALFVAWTPLRRTRLSEQSLPLLHDVSNELFDAHGVDELGTAVERLATSLNASTTALFILEDDQFVVLPRQDVAPGDVRGTVFGAGCPQRILDVVRARGRSAFWPTPATLVADLPDCRAWIDDVHARSIAAVPIRSKDSASGVLLVTYSNLQTFD